MNVLAISFLSGSRLWLLLVAAALVGAYVVVQVRRRADAVRFTNIALLDTVAPRRPGWRRHVAAVLFLVGLTTLIVAFARPARAVRFPREQATVIMAIDVSLSMEAADVAPNRLEAAQGAARSFLDQLPPRLNVGLVSFDGIARLTVPPTREHEAIEHAIDRIDLGPGTAIGEAIFAALDALKQVPGSEPTNGRVPAAVVLLSDGATTVGRPDEAGSDAARAARVPVSTIAFGTPHGQVQIEGAIFPVPVPVNEEALRQIANDTGGRFFAAATRQELAQVYETLGSQVGFESKKREVTSWFMGAALVAFLARAGAGLVWTNRLP